MVLRTSYASIPLTRISHQADRLFRTRVTNQDVMFKNTVREERHAVLFGFWLNGFSSCPAVSNTSVYNKVIVKCAIKL